MANVDRLPQTTAPTCSDSTMTFSLEADLALAHRLADAARAVSLARFRGELQRRQKADGSLVTDADEAVEDTIREQLRRERPADAMLGEERGQTGEGARRWIVDGIDGTQSFAAGTPHWGTLIALEIDGEIAVGVCDAAPLDRRYWASRGGGAFRADRGAAATRLSVTATSDLAAAASLVPLPEWQRDAAARAAAAALVEATRRTQPTDHPALAVAAGAADLAVFFLAGPWDLAAPSIVVEEAGGRFTDLAGRHAVAGRGAVFSNGRVHDAALALTTPHFP